MMNARLAAGTEPTLNACRAAAMQRHLQNEPPIIGSIPAHGYPHGEAAVTAFRLHEGTLMLQTMVANGTVVASALETAHSRGNGHANPNQQVFRIPAAEVAVLTNLNMPTAAVVVASLTMLMPTPGGGVVRVSPDGSEVHGHHGDGLPLDSSDWDTPGHHMGQIFGVTGSNAVAPPAANLRLSDVSHPVVAAVAATPGRMPAGRAATPLIVIAKRCRRRNPDLPLQDQFVFANYNFSALIVTSSDYNVAACLAKMPSNGEETVL